MKAIGVLIAMIITMLLSCSKKEKEKDGYTLYTIRQGEHQSNHNNFQDIVNDSVLTFNVIFDSSAVYSNNNKNNEEDINKLFGVSDCGIMHHFNSARIGWRWFNNSLELLAYSYSNGKRETSLIGSFPINKELQCAISCKKEKYVFEVNGQKAETKRTCSTNEHYLLYPYFGGNEVAPHTIKIKIAHLNKKQ